MGAFLQSVTDYSDIWEYIGPNGRIQAEFLISEDIARLREAGLVVYAAARNYVIEGGVGVPAPRPVAYITIRRNSEEVAKGRLANT